MKKSPEKDAGIVRRVRELKGLTQIELASAARVSEPTIRRLEAGDTRVKVAVRARVAECLGLAFDWKSHRIEPPKHLPESAFRTQSKSATRMLEVPAEVLTAIKAAASAEGVTVAEWLRAVAMPVTRIRSRLPGGSDESKETHDGPARPLPKGASPGSLLGLHG